MGWINDRIKAIPGSKKDWTKAATVAAVAAGGYYAYPYLASAMGGASSAAGAAGSTSGVLGTIGKVGSALSPFTSLISGGVGGYYAQKGAADTNSSAREIADKQMAFQHIETSTAHQREVADLKAAGLNPILSGTGGMGAASGAGASAPVVNEKGAGVMAALQAASTAKSIQQQEANIQYTQAQTHKLKTFDTEKTIAETDNIGRDSVNKSVQTDKISAEKNLTLQQTAQATQATALLDKQNVSESLKNQILRSDVITARSVATKAAEEGKISESTYGKILMYLDRATSTIGDVFHGSAHISK